MKEQILKGKCLYTPGGAAREYAAVGCNFYRGCPFMCTYCYNRKGITSKINGLPYGVLEDCFTNVSRRPKKYQHMSATDYAFMVFKNEVEKWYDHLLEHGIFFSFSTDPLCPEACDLTVKAALYAAEKGIDVKILTKNARRISSIITPFLDDNIKKHIAIGFTLTGRDEVEPFAAPNEERIYVMYVLHNMGINTFASIEPIVDFDSSFKMIEKTINICDQYMIGLMSNRKANGYEPYSVSECNAFIHKVSLLASTLHNVNRGIRIYWKESIKKLCNDPFNEKYVFNNFFTVGRDWSLFNKRRNL